MNGKKYVICDIEATGLDSECELIEIALVTWRDGKIEEIYETLVNPLRAVPEYISNLTSISNRDLQEAPKFYEVADAIRMRLEGAVFVSHNTEFDLGLLKRKYREMGEELKLKNFCILKVAQHEIPGLKNYNLDALCSFFHIKIQDRHRAVGDALATLELFKELLQLRLKVQTKPFYLPHHEKELKNISARAGLLHFKDARGKVIHFEATFNMEKKARELLLVKAENKALLLKTETISEDVTGSALIAEFKKLLFVPYKPHWVIIETEKEGLRNFRIRPFQKNLRGLWYFQDYFDAKKKMKTLEASLKGDNFVYREGGRSKEEFLKHNAKVDQLQRDAKFPSENLVIIGEGRTLGEKSLVLIRNNHVLGYGYTEASVEEIYQTPDAFLTRRFYQHLGVDLVARKYIKILKNLKTKTEGWRSLADSTVTENK